MHIFIESKSREREKKEEERMRARLKLIANLHMLVIKRDERDR